MYRCSWYFKSKKYYKDLLQRIDPKIMLIWGRGWEKEVTEGRERTFFSSPHLSLFSHLTLVQLSRGYIHHLHKHRQNQTSSILSVKQHQNCCSGSLPVYRDMRYRPWLACSKSHCQFANQAGWREIQNTFPVICLVHWVPEQGFNCCCFTDVTHSLIGVSWHLRKQCSYWLLLLLYKTQMENTAKNKQTTCYAGHNIAH